MGSRGPRHLRKTTNVVLDALVTAAEAALHGHSITIEALEQIVAGLKTSGTFDGFYRRSYRELMDVVESEKREQRRTKAFGRMLIHGLGPLLENGSISREMVPNVFSFIHLVLGDEGEVYAGQCADIVKALKDELGDEFSWDAFYRDRRAKLILWHTLVRVAASFKRYELRKDWFVKLMQYRPTTVSLGSNAFIVREHDTTEEPYVFGEHEFCMFFHALFDPLKDLSPEDDALFRKEFGTDPHHLIGDFLINMTSCTV